MFGLGAPELMIILGIGVLLFGGKKLPEMGEGLGRGISNFKLAMRNQSADAPVKELVAGPKAEKTT